MNSPNPKHPPNAPDPLAVALANLDPVPHGFDWNSLMFAAGRASKERALAFWRIVAGVCALIAFGCAGALFLRPPTARVVYVDRVVPAPPPSRSEVSIVPAPAPRPLPVPPTKPGAASARPEPVAGWRSDPPLEQGAAARWLSFRNEVLTIGLGVLPDPGLKVSPPRAEK